MKKVYLMKGMALAAVTVAAVSCSKDLGGYDPRTQEAQIANAEMQLGVQIDPNQDWEMKQQVEASVFVNGDFGASYEVMICKNNPFVDNSVEVYGESKIASGQTAKMNVTMPKGVSTAFVALKDEKGYYYVKPVRVVDGVIDTAFGATSGSNRAMTRGVVEDNTVPSITAPTAAEMQAAYLDGATEVNDANAVDNADNSQPGYWDNDYNSWNYDTNNWNQKWVEPTVDETFVLKMKITGTRNGYINVLATEGYYTTWNNDLGFAQATSKQDPYCARTVYVSGTWNINDQDQTVGSGGVIVVANGGVINIASGKKLTLVNEARLIVLPGGTIQGEGNLLVTNGNSADGWSYNGGTINLNQFNNNFGEFYNYGTMTLQQMLGPGHGSRYINHGHVYITAADKGSGTASLRLLNNCWFECAGTLALRNIIQGPGAYIKTGNLEMSCGNDGSTDPSYIYAGANSLIDVTGAVAFNNVRIVGPTTNGDYGYIQAGYAEGAWGAHGLSTAMNYTVDNGVMVTGIENNIRFSVDHPDVDDNVHGNTPYETLLDMLNGTCEYSYTQYNEAYPDYAKDLLPQQGNGNAVMVAKGQVNTISEESECSPGIQVVPPTPVKKTYPIYSYAFEDTPEGDYDLNDVVIKVQQDENDTTKLNLKFVASGATLDLYVRLYNSNAVYGSENANDFRLLSHNGKTEIHEMFGVEHGIMINTLYATGQKAAPFTIQIDKGSYDPAHLPISIWSDTWKEVVLAGAGDTPHGVIIPADWKWPKERVHVTEAYAETETSEPNPDQSFGTYANDANAGADLWWKYPTRSVINEATLGY